MNWRAAAAGAAFASLLCAFFPSVVFKGEMFLFTAPTANDIVRVHLPFRTFLEHSPKDKGFPLWSREAYCGYPIHAEGQGSFCHPVSWAASRLLPAPQALNAVILSGFMISGLLMMLYMRSIGGSWPAALLSAFAFGLGGYTFQKIHHVNILLTMCWTGLVFYGWERAFQGRSGLVTPKPRRGEGGWLPGAVTAGAGWALQILAGYPGYAYYTFWAAFAYAVYGFWGRPRQGLAALAVFGAVGIGLSAVQWLPTWELVGESLRSSGLSYKDAVSGHYRWGDLATWILPSFLGDPAADLKALDRGYVFWENASYMGAVPALLALFGAVSGAGSAGRHRFFIGLFLVAMALVLETPPYRLFWEALPGFKFFRLPAKMLFMAVFSGAVLAGFGLDRLRSLLKAKWRPAVAGVLLILTAGELWSYSRGRYGTVRPEDWLTPPAVMNRARGERTRTVSYHAYEVFKSIAGQLVVRGLYEGDRRLAPFRAWKELLGPGADLTWGILGSWTGYTEIPLRRLYALQRACVLRSEDNRSLALKPGVADLLRAQSVEFIVSPFRVTGPDCERVAHIPGPAPVYVHRVRDVPPRAWVVGARRLVRDGKAAIGLIRGPVDPRREVVLEDEAAPPAEPEASGSRVRWLADEPRHIELEVEARGRGYLVLADSHYPGWKAAVDGRPAPILRANGAFRAVRLERGTRRVTFDYDPWTFKTGFALSTITAVLVAAWLLLR